MSNPASHNLTALLKRAGAGDQQAESELMEIVYPELRRVASRRLRRERNNHTLQTTGLINEVFLRLFRANPVEWNDRSHFFAVAARQMRFILIDHGHRKHRGGLYPISLDETVGEDVPGLTVRTEEDLIALDEALRQLESIDRRACLGVELRFFGGLTLEETAQALQVNVATVKRDWRFAKSWLYRQLHLPAATNS